MMVLVIPKKTVKNLNRYNKILYVPIVFVSKTRGTVFEILPTYLTNRT